MNSAIDETPPGALVLSRTAAGVGSYGKYVGELLRSEGLVDFDLVKLDGDDLAARLDHGRPRVVIVTTCLVTRTEADLIAAYARNGGNLIVLRPSWVMAERLGLRPTGQSSHTARLRLDGDHRIGRTLAPVIQTLTPVEHLEPAEDACEPAVVARLDDEAGAAAPCGIVEYRLGQGRVIAFGYDLGQAVAKLRHGDSTAAGVRSNGALPYRCTDALVGLIDGDLVGVPQSDVHCQLLANSVAVLDPGAPRYWYYAAADVATIGVQDSDDDWSTSAEFDNLFAAAAEFGFPITCYLMQGQRPTALSPHDVVARRAEGHSFGIHHDALPAWADGEDQNLVIEGVVRLDIAAFVERYGFRPRVNRNHCLVWWGTSELAELYDDLGIQMELNAQGPDPFWLKYNVGSARPMRHVTPSGRILDVFQQPTVIYDDAAIADRLGGRSAEEAARVLSYVDEALSGGYMPLTMQSHPLSFSRYSAPFFRAVWAGLRQRGVDIISAEQWADYVIARDASRLRSVTEPDGTVRVEVRAVGESTQAVALQSHAGSVITVDGAPVRPRQRVIGGLDWDIVTVAAAADGAQHLIEQRIEQRQDATQSRVP